MASISRNACSSLLLLAVFAGAPAVAVESDDALLDGLEAAVERSDKHRAMSALSERIAAAPLPVEATDRAVRLIMSDELYVESYAARILPALAGEGGFSEQSLIVIASGLAGEWVVPHPSQPKIAELFTSSSTPLPEEAFAALESALADTTPANSRAVLQALAATPHDDPRFDRALEAIRTALVSGEYNHTRSDASKMLERMSESVPLPSTVIESLVHVATTDEHLLIRMDALEALAIQPLDPDLATRLSESLAAEIVTPTPELRQRSRGHIYFRYFDKRATDVMARLHEPPYPAHVVFAWIALTKADDIDAPLAKISAVIGRGELTPEQHAGLNRVAEQHRIPAKRQQIYATLYAEQDSDRLPQTVRELATAGDDSLRVRAGYRLLQQFEETGVPREVADVAAGVLETDASSETLVVAAMLLGDTREDRDTRQEQLVSALHRHPKEYDLYDPVVDAATRDRSDGAVIRYAADESLAAEFRRHLLRRFSDAAGEQAELSVDAERTLRIVASKADDYYVIQYAGDALEAWGARVPLRVVVRNRENQSIALFGVYISIVVLNLIVFVVGLAGVVRMPLASVDGRRLRRVGLVVGWLASFAVVLVVLAIGFIGFIGHNSLPAPSSTLAVNVPAYIATILFVFAARAIWRRGKS